MTSVPTNREWRAGLEPLLFCVAVVAQAAPLVLMRRFPSEDGPSHIGSGEIIGRYNGILERYFEVQFMDPNISVELLAAGLLRVISPITTSRVIVLLCLVGLPLAARYAFTALGRSGRWLSWLTIPLASSWFLHLGLFNFCLGCVLMLLALGYWWRHEGEGPLAIAILAALLFVTLTTHVVPFFIAVLLLVARAAWQLFDRRPGERTTLLDVALASCLPTALALAYMAREWSDASIRQSLRDLVLNLATQQQSFMAYDRLERLPGIALVAMLAVLMLLAVRDAMPRRWRDRSTALLAAAAMILVTYFVLPDTKERGGGDLTPRLGVLLFVTLLAWLSQFGFDRRVLRAAAGVSVAASVLLYAVRMPIYAGFEEEIDEFVSIADLIEENRTVLTVNLAQDTDVDTDLTHSFRVRPTLLLTGWLMAERHVVDLGHYEAYFTVHPFQFRPEVEPFGPIGGGGLWLSQSPPDIDILGYEEATDGAGRIDYVLVFGRVAASDEVLDDPLTAALDAQLAEGFELVATSSPRGLVELYRRTD